MTLNSTSHTYTTLFSGKNSTSHYKISTQIPFPVQIKLTTTWSCIYQPIGRSSYSPATNINNCYKSHTYSEDWTESNIKLILKPNKRALRLIFLTSKIAERLVSRRIQPWLSHPPNLNSAKNRSTINNIAGLIIKTKEDLKRKKNPAVTLLDVNAAFDNVLPDLLFSKLKKNRTIKKLFQTRKPIFTLQIQPVKYILLNFNTKESHKVRISAQYFSPFVSQTSQTSRL